MSNTGVLHRATLYDVGIWLLTLGRERRFRERLLAPARLQPGEAVLDVGCGTGSLAMLARQQVGAAGVVAGIDAAPEMIARARRKANKARLDIQFETASADALPYANAHFDAVLCTVALHHLPRAVRSVAVAEMARVMRPAGRVFLADFVFGHKPSVVGMLHHQHGLRPNALTELVEAAGLRVAERGSLGKWDLEYVVARAGRS